MQYKSRFNPTVQQLENPFELVRQKDIQNVSRLKNPEQPSITHKSIAPTVKSRFLTQEIQVQVSQNTLKLPVKLTDDIINVKKNLNNIQDDDDYQIDDEYGVNEGRVSEQGPRDSIRSEQSFQLDRKFIQNVITKNNQADKIDPLTQDLQKYYRLSPFDKQIFISSINQQIGIMKKKQSLQHNQDIPQPEEFLPLQEVFDTKKIQPAKQQVHLDKHQIMRQPSHYLDDKPLKLEKPPLVMKFLQRKVNQEEDFKRILKFYHKGSKLNNIEPQQLFIYQNVIDPIIQNLFAKLKEGEESFKFIYTELVEIRDIHEQFLQRYQEKLDLMIQLSRTGTHEQFIVNQHRVVCSEVEDFLTENSKLKQRIKIDIIKFGQRSDIAKIDSSNLDKSLTEIIAQIQKNKNSLLQIFQVDHVNQNEISHILKLALNKEHNSSTAQNLQEIYNFINEIESFLQKISPQISLILEEFMDGMKNKIEELQQVFYNFRKDCEYIDIQFKFQAKCEKIQMFLHQGLSYIRGINIPMNQPDNKVFNSRLVKMASLRYVQAYNKLDKYFNQILVTFPNEEIQNEITNDRRRINLAKNLARQTDDMDVFQQIKQFSILLIKRIELFGLCNQTYTKYHNQINHCKELNEFFKNLDQVELQIYEIQQQREELQIQLIKTENSVIITSQINQINKILEQLKLILNNMMQLHFKKNFLIQKESELKNHTQGSPMNEKQVIQEYNELGNSPIQIKRFIWWLQVEIGACEKLLSLHNDYYNFYKEEQQMQYDSESFKSQLIQKRLNFILNKDPTVTEILQAKLDDTNEYQLVLAYICQITLHGDGGTERDKWLYFDLSRTEPWNSTDIEIIQLLNNLYTFKNTVQLSKLMRKRYTQLYKDMSLLYNKFTIWQNIQSCKCVMDGDVFSQIITYTLLFDTKFEGINEKTLVDEITNIPLISLQRAKELLYRLNRGFILNIKFDQNCVFYKVFTEQGIYTLQQIWEHFQKLSSCLKLQYNEKKQVKIDEMNSDLWKQVSQQFKDKETPIYRIKQQLGGALRFYQEKNSYLFETKGTTLDWDNKLQIVKQIINEFNQSLYVAHEYLKLIAETSLLDQYTPKNQNSNKRNTRITFTPEEFQIGAVPLHNVQQLKIKLQKEKFDLEDLQNNQVDKQEYKDYIIYYIGVINEALLWARAIEKISRIVYIIMGRIKDDLSFEDTVSSDYIRQIRLFCEEVQVNIKEILELEFKSPYSKLNSDNIKKYIPPKELVCQITNGYKIDNLLLIIHKVAKLSQSSAEILLKIANNILRFQKIQQPDALITIHDDFFDILNRLVVFILGEDQKNAQSKKDELAEPVFDKKKGDEDFYKHHADIPYIFKFPKQVLQNCLNSFNPLIDEIKQHFDLKALNKLNQIVMVYKNKYEITLLSLQDFVLDHEQLLKANVQGNKKLSQQIIVKYGILCSDSQKQLFDFFKMLQLVIKLVQSDQFRKQKSLNKLEDEELWNNFIQTEYTQWMQYMEQVKKLISEYKDAEDKKDCYDKHNLEMEVSLNNLLKINETLQFQQHNNLLIRLYKDFQTLILFDLEYN